MKILKTSALAAILAMGSFSANASSYSGEFGATKNLRFQAIIAQQLSIDMTNNKITYENLLPGETISSTMNFTLTGSDTATVECLVSNLTVYGTANTNGRLFGFKPTDATDNYIDEFRIKMTNECSASTAGDDHTLYITGTVSPTAPAGAVYTRGLVLQVDYVPRTSAVAGSQSSV